MIRPMTVLPLLLLLALPPTAVAQDNAALAAQRRAQAVLADAVEGFGGQEALKSLRHARIELMSQLSFEGQGLNPDSGLNEGSVNRVMIHMDGPLAAYQTFNGDTPNFRAVDGADGLWVHFAANNNLSTVEPAAATGFFQRITLSPFYILEALERPEVIRGLGTVSVDGRDFHAVAYADEIGQQLTLYFDTSTGLLGRVENLATHPQHGDVIVAISFDDYREIDGLQVPHALTRKQGADITAKTSVESIQIGVESEMALFERPEDANEGQPIQAPAPGPRALEVEDVAEGVHLIAGAAPGYNAMFVAYDQGILVLETPISPAVTRDVIRAIGERYPDRPVRWAVPTHYHYDHSGGLYGYIDQGVTIVTTEGNADFVRYVANVPRTIGRLRPRDGDRSLALDAFSGRRSFGEGDRRVELIDVGPNPHVDEIIVPYFPELGIIFVADLFGFQGEVTPANQNALAFADRLEELGLEFETVIPVHGQRATAEQFWRAVRLGREQQAAR